MLIASFTATLALAAVSPATAFDSCASIPVGRPVPADVVADRFFVRWGLRAGGELRFYLDTGGGTNLLFPDAVRRGGFPTRAEALDGDTATLALVSRAAGIDAFPAIGDPDSATIRFWVPPVVGEYQRLIEEFESLDGLQVDGLLGPPWHAAHLLSFDYAGRRVLLHEPAALAAIAAECWVPVAFQMDSSGARTSNYPRITAVVGGDTVELLFDTGAMTTLTDSAWALADPREPKRRATSFITRERFDRWRAQHPDWQVIMNAERGTGAAMIRAPWIEIGGRRTGPVWFTSRPNASFHNFMSQWMDRRIDGALGGSGLRSFVAVLDYPRSRVALLSRAPGR